MTEDRGEPDQVNSLSPTCEQVERGEEQSRHENKSPMYGLSLVTCPHTEEGPDQAIFPIPPPPPIGEKKEKSSKNVLIASSEKIVR